MSKPGFIFGLPSAGPGPLESEKEVDTGAFDVNHYFEVQKQFLQLLELGKHSDVTFIITENEEDHRIPAHRAILASKSEYFDRLLFGEMKEAHPDVEIPLQDTPLEAFQLLMKYTYCGKMKIEDQDLQLKFDIVSLADRFGFHFLKSVLDVHLGTIVCYSNVLPIFMHADLFQLEQAKASCFHFLDANAQSVLNVANEDLLSLPQKYLENIVCRDSFVTEEIDIFMLVRKWLQHNNKTKDDSASLLQLVRLCEIPPKLLFAEVEPTGIFDKETMFEAMKVSCKPELERMTPRGFTESDQNLFKEEDVLYKYTYNVSPQPNWRETSNTTSALTKRRHSFQPNDTLHQDSTQVSTGWYKSSPGLQLGGTSSTGLQKSSATVHHTRSSVLQKSSTTVHHICSSGSISGVTSSTSHFPIHNTGLSKAPTSIIIKLKRVYLVNNITLELKNSSSQYTIQVSRDTKTWRQLIDYSRLMTCTGRQVLWFPKQAVRYVQFAPSRNCTVVFHSCALKSEVPAFALRDPGAIAPLEAFTPLYLKTVKANSDGMAGYEVTFHQPYSFSLLRLMLLRDFDEGDSIDMEITIHGHAQTYNFKDQEFGKDIEVRFAEKIAHRFQVLAKPTEPETSEEGSKEEESEEDESEGEEQPSILVSSTYTTTAPLVLSLDSFSIGQFNITFVIEAS